ncbi:MAG TPA: NAD(P)/FAD-dependent oxidoreductase [Egicoccus sp.]|nr:NAD(P)/FAD-dependent oxidoreductase [Egicoccus sp.]HSK22041.1 NAD(P)/FAD-dependent oxidoreductase [Egicoccus sp.]
MATDPPTPPESDVDVLVVGGGPAGLAAALVLARSRRSVVVVDAGEPRNAPAEAVHAFLTRDGTPPARLLELARAEVAGYGVEVRTGRVVGAARGGDRFLVDLDGDTAVTARRLVVTTGLVDELPPLPGLAERFGRDVVHCPYCHGYEVRDRRIGVLATSPMSTHQAGLFRQLSDRVVYLRHTGPAPDPEAWAGLAARGVDFVEGEVAGIDVRDDHLVGVALADGSRVDLDVLVVAPRFVARAEMLAGLGLEAVEHPSGVGLYVPAEPTGRTGVPGVWVAGNVADPSAQVVSAAAQGNLAGAHVNADLVAEDTALARQGVA